MRILWLSYYYLPHVGGGTWGTYHLSLQLSKRGHSVQLIVPNIKHRLSIPPESSISLEKSNPSSIHRTPMIRIPRLLGPLLSSLFIFSAGLRLAKNPDIIVSQHHPHTFLTPIAVFLGKILKVPVVIRADDVYREMSLGFIVKIANTFNECFIKYARFFLVVCSEQREILLSRLRNRPSSCRIRLSYNGVDLSEFKDAQKKEYARKTLGIRNEEKVFLFVGRSSGLEYGIEIVLKALPTILLREPKTLLILVGDELNPRLHSMINSLGVSKNVRAYGSKTHKEIIKFITSADVCLGVFTETQAIPLKILEYMACLKPVVTGIKSVSRDLNPNSNFLVVPPEPEAVAKAIIKILQDENYARKLGSNGRKQIEKFRWSRIAGDFETTLFSALSYNGE